jgi:spore maturation protein CgeB
MNDSSLRLERPKPLDIVIVGAASAAVWGPLVPALTCRRHRVTFLQRGGGQAPFEVQHYEDLRGLHRHAERIASADAVIVSSSLPQGAEVGRWVLDTARGVRAFYDLDGPVTLSRLEGGEQDLIEPDQIGEYDLYLSLSGGPTLQRLEQVYGARRARTLYGSVDAETYMPVQVPKTWALGYLGEPSPDRPPLLEALLLEPARRRPELQFVLGGASQPQAARPSNVAWRGSVSPSERPAFYCAQRFTLNLTRPDLAAIGFSPPTRLFEAAACGVPIVSDTWNGLEELFTPEREILLVYSTADVLRVLDDVDDAERERIATAARRRVLAAHTSDHRALELVEYIRSAGAEESRTA